MRNNDSVYYLASVAARNEVLVDIECTRIQYMEKYELLAVQGKLQLGETWGCISCPKEWLAPGALQCAATVHITSACDNAFSAADKELAILATTRFAILLFLVPIFGRRWRTLLSVSTILTYIRTSLPLVRIALTRPDDNPKKIFSRLCASDLDGISTPKDKAVVMDHMVSYAGQGYWNDVPLLHSGKKDEPSRSARARHPPAKGDANEWMPLPDDFVAEAGWRMIWITKTLGPAVLTCAEALISKYQTLISKDASKSYAKNLRSEIAKSHLANYLWAGPNGAHLLGLPFDFQAVIRRARKRNFVWPPRCLSDLLRMLNLTQISHLFLFLLCTGARPSEALGLKTESMVESAGQNLMTGRSFKPSFSNEGRKQDWPLPPTLVFALTQQERLSAVTEGIKLWTSKENEVELPNDILFVSPKTGVGLGASYNSQLKTAISCLKLDEKLDARGLHGHRFRKTLARLGALAIVGAPKIFMDLFGHENINSTLSYMLSDPLLQAEMQEIRRAEVIMLAEKAIETADDNGGRAAEKIKAAVDAERVRLGKRFNQDSIRALAVTFTMSGEIFQLVRPGVLCTKTPLQCGPCNKGVARPEPSRCSSQCDHRLEMAALRDDVYRAIEEAVDHLKKAEAEGNLFEVEVWEGQILQNLKRFPDLTAQWTKNEVVSNVIGRNRGGQDESRQRKG